MKAITLEQPFASLVSIGVKTIDTRPWSTDYRGPLAIHSGKSDMDVTDPYYRTLLIAAGLDCEQLPVEKIVAIADLVGCEKVITSEIPCYPQLAFSDFISGWYVLELADIRPLEIPVSARGDAKLWEWEESSFRESCLYHKPVKF